ncbi:proline dehydrogenase family protein [Lysinibacillus irui]|uniref:proline dehydrogenase n=1 Tax=Lysinibacillus irui TaxID=2998077 RepID=A0ABU5NP69_9BACI|nr:MULTISPECIES: proline dehydrogenase family protein [Lysinibacillus]MEA0551912.1 proline dehydrogenase family protein [Lysinibacillus irui]MEA0977837.1 proline dehydrogenase family protein [Lysinibacillus irui]MEA1043991.1 proline dehydrogenase family protein [Lysinibacillus irui]
MLNEERRFSKALKSIARDQELKAYFQNSKELFPIFIKGANRFVAGETRTEGIERVINLYNKGYRVSLEFIGENTTSLEECMLAKNEFKELIKDLGYNQMKATVSFDLSHIGMMISDEVAFTNLEELAKEAQQHNIQLMISMEESQKTDKILSLYKRISKSFSNVGITLQVHLKRSSIDLNGLLKTSGRIRLVKGAYQESEGIYIPRTEELNKRYIEFVSMCIDSNHPLSVATHDENILMDLKEKGFLYNSNVEVEMLDGVRPDLLRSLKEDNIQTKVYVTYGSEWYLYVVHRIAEYPPNIYTFISDMIEQSTNRDKINTY